MELGTRILGPAPLRMASKEKAALESLKLPTGNTWSHVSCHVSCHVSRHLEELSEGSCHAESGQRLLGRESGARERVRQRALAGRRVAGAQQPRLAALLGVVDALLKALKAYS